MTENGLASQLMSLATSTALLVLTYLSDSPTAWRQEQTDTYLKQLSVPLF